MSAPGSSVGLVNLDGLDFAKGGGLLPAIVQHADSGAVLMLGYMNRQALEATLEQRRVVFFSRSKGRLWEKGETSGHVLEFVHLSADCDGDAVLVTARPRGPTCHLGAASCFGESHLTVGEGLRFLIDLERIIDERRTARPNDSYTARLFAEGVRRIAQKVGEEGLEVALAGVSGKEREVVSEAADLLYHLIVLLNVREVSLGQVISALRNRHAERVENKSSGSCKPAELS